MKKLLLLFSMLLAVSTFCFADTENKDDGIVVGVDVPDPSSGETSDGFALYLVFKKSKVAYLIQWNTSSERIPQTIEYEGDTYTVIGILEIGNRIGKTLYVPSTIKYIYKNVLQNYDDTKLKVSDIHSSNVSGWMAAKLIGNYFSMTEFPVDKPQQTVNSHVDTYVSRVAADYPIDDKTYLLYDNETPMSGDFTGENRFGGPKYKGFSNCQYIRNMENIEFDESVTSISELSFFGCRNLKSVKFPTQLDSIGRNAFNSCVSLEHIVWPDNLKFISELAFRKNLSLKELILPKGLMAIEYKTFADCSSLKKIELPEGLEKIGMRSFERCSSLESVSLPNTLKSIGIAAFTHCDSLKDISLPASLVNMQDSVFYECQNLRKVVFQGKLRNIGKSMFEDCTKLETVRLPDELDTIPNSIFYRCYGLKDVNIPVSTKSIEDFAFYGTGMDSVAFPEGLKKIGFSAFGNCSNLAKIILPNSLDSIGDFAFSYCRNVRELRLPNTIKTIPQSAFRELEKLEVLELPSSITNIEDRAFADCNFKEIKGWDGLVNLVRIGPSSFENSLKEWTRLVIPPGVGIISNGAFKGSEKLEYLELPAWLNYLGSGAFADCYNLKTIVCWAKTPPDNYGAFPWQIVGADHYTGTATLYVPKGCGDLYRNSSIWKNFSNIVEMDSGVEELEQEAFDASLPVEMISLTGVSMGTFPDLQTAEASVAPGIYICRQGSNVQKIAVK